MILSAALGVLGLFLGVGCTFFSSFGSTGHLKGIDGLSVSASLFYLSAGNGHITGIDEFCDSDESTCHHSKCQGQENAFCSMRDSSVLISYGAAALAIFHAVGLMLVCMDFTSACLIPTDRAWIFASRVAWVQAGSAVLYVILLFVWGDCLGRLPDLNSFTAWQYLPANEGLNWSLDYGFYLLIVAVIMEIASAACSFIGSMKLTETVPAHLREQRSFSEWAYKSHLSISAFSAFAAFVLSFFVLLSNSFVANVQVTEGTNAGIAATMFSLRIGTNVTSIPDFCARGVSATTCGTESCEGMETTFCSLRYATISFQCLAMIVLFLQFVVALAACLELRLGIQPRVLVSSTSCAQVVAALLTVILLPLWGAVKGELPDVTTYDTTGELPGIWIYLPSSEGTEWRFGWGYVLTFPVALLSIVAAVSGGYGAYVMNETDTAALNPGQSRHEPLAATTHEGAVTPRADRTEVPMRVGGGRVNEDKYQEYTDSTL